MADEIVVSASVRVRKGELDEELGSCEKSFTLTASPPEMVGGILEVNSGGPTLISLAAISGAEGFGWIQNIGPDADIEIGYYDGTFRDLFTLPVGMGMPIKPSGGNAIYAQPVSGTQHLKVRVLEA